MSANLELLWMLLEHLTLTALPAALGVFLAMRRGLRSVSLLLCIALAASGATAMLAFWAYYVDPTIGQATAFLIVLGSIYGIVLCRPDRLDRALLRELAVPAALWALGSAFVVYLGFLHGGTDQPLALATTRFSHPLPTDNEIPRFFADWYFHHGHHGPPPPFADWLSSDRPPLAGWLRAGTAPVRLGPGRAPLRGTRSGDPAALDRRHVGSVLRRPAPTARQGPGDVRADGERHRHPARLLRLAEVDRSRFRSRCPLDRPLRRLAPTPDQPVRRRPVRGPLRLRHARARGERIRADSLD